MSTAPAITLTSAKDNAGFVGDFFYRILPVSSAD